MKSQRSQPQTYADNPVGLAAIEVVLTMAAFIPISVVVFVLIARLARWFYFLIIHSVGSPLF